MIMIGTTNQIIKKLQLPFGAVDPSFGAEARSAPFDFEKPGVLCQNSLETLAPEKKILKLCAF